MSKFKIKEPVFIFRSKGAHLTKIKKIRTEEDEKGKNTEYYVCIFKKKNEKGEIIKRTYSWINENYIYKTKEEMVRKLRYP